jgi:mannose-1-phosphate guanylyltransferase / mannose-6-phosphate isomerase
MAPTFIPFILCGGSGTRLWPTSRASMPKQYCDLFGVNLFETTLLRFAKAAKFGIVSTSAQLPLIQKCTPKSMAATPRVQILEPIGRNTAPAIALAVRALIDSGNSGDVIGIFPADHFIGDTATFLAAVERATKIASDGAIVTLGIKPTYPATGYGYIETRHAEGASDSRVATRFHEKPDAARAATYLESGSFFWNAGIFVARVDALAKAFETHAKELWASVGSIKDPLSPTKEEYAEIPSASFDVAIME